MDSSGKPGSFLGTGWSFPPQFSRAGQTVMVSDERDIRDSLLILLSTRPGERVMHPLFGCGLHSLVFETVGESERTALRALVARAIASFEPRVAVDLIAVLADSDDAALLHVEIGYRVLATNSAQNLVFPLYLENGTVRHG